jgi:hypothetical protein
VWVKSELKSKVGGGGGGGCSIYSLALQEQEQDGNGLGGERRPGIRAAVAALLAAAAPQEGGPGAEGGSPGPGQLLGSSLLTVSLGRAQERLACGGMQ